MMILGMGTDGVYMVIDRGRVLRFSRRGSQRDHLYIELLRIYPSPLCLVDP